MTQHSCDLKIHVNGQETFFLNEKIVALYSGTLRKLIKQEKKSRTIELHLHGFPGGPHGFELVSRFCHNNGRIRITVSNVSLLHCCAVFLDMTELLQQTEIFLEGMFYWSWGDVILSLKSCESFFEYADSCSKTGLVQKLVCALLAKIAQNSDMASPSKSSSSSSSSPETTSSSSRKASWWFSELTILPPKIIERVIKTMGGYGTDNNSLVLTRFLLHYLKSVSPQTKCGDEYGPYGGLADTAAHGVILVGKTTFSCRGLFLILRVLSGFGLSKYCRIGLERMIGGMLDQATLDDLLVSGHHDNHKGVFDVNLVLRLIRVFVDSDDAVSAEKMKKVGRLIDKYLGEIAPDQNLKVSKFLGVAESLPDSARNCYDGVYRAIDIYLESHPTLSSEDRSKLCRCLNYEKLTLEACKDLAKNPRIPPRVSVQALMSQQSTMPPEDQVVIVNDYKSPKKKKKSESQIVLYKGIDAESFSDENEDMRLNLQRMQWRVKQLEKVCRDMKGQMSRMVRESIMSSTTSPAHNRALTRLC